jgi:hypothetical protein
LSTSPGTSSSPVAFLFLISLIAFPPPFVKYMGLFCLCLLLLQVQLLGFDEDILGCKFLYRLRNIKKLTINSSEDEFDLNCIYSCHFYSTVNIHLVYKMQSVAALQGKNRCCFLRSVQNTHTCPVWSEFRIF